MHFAILGSGGVGGYYGAKLALAGHRVTFIARGAHLKAIRERGLMVWSPLGDFTVRGAAEEDTSRVGVVDMVIVAVKTYHNPQALPMIKPMVGERTTVLTLQNGVDSCDEVARVIGEAHVLGGSAYVATALTAPGLIEQTGVHRRIVFGEVFGERTALSERAERIHKVLSDADIEAEVHADARPQLWEKFIYLAPFAAFTGAARLPIGPLWDDPQIRDTFLDATAEVERVAHAEGVAVAPATRDRMVRYMNGIPPTTRSSMLIDLSQGKPIEVEALQGAVVRRGRAVGVSTPIMSALYAVLKPHADGDAARR